MMMRRLGSAAETLNPKFNCKLLGGRVAWSTFLHKDEGYTFPSA